MATDTYTGDLGAAESRIQSLTKAVSSGVSGLPGVSEALRKSLYDREKVLPALEVENENKIKELYTADKRYAERYATPGSDMYIENPMQRQALISGQKADIRGELGNILNLIQQRQQTMGNAIDKGMELYKMGLEAQKLELDQAEKTWSRILEKQKFDFEKQRANKGTAAQAQQAKLKELIASLRGGAGLSQAMRDYSADFTPDEIYSQYTVNSPYVDEAMRNTGRPVYESPQELQSKFGITRELKYRESGWSDQETDSNINRILSGQANLADYTPSQQSDLQTRAGELKLGTLGRKPVAENVNWWQKTTSDLEDKVAEAQGQIDKYTDPLQRAQVWYKYVTEYPNLKPYLTY